MINKIEEKKAEIANYERILAAYYGRWYDQGKRHLEDLKRQLQDLESHAAVADVVIAGV